VGELRPSWIEIDLDAIRHNVTAIGERVAPSQVCAVVKADAYGHGDVPVAEAAIEAGASWLAVALISEGARLREAGVTDPIMLLSEPMPGDAAEVVRWNLTPTLYRPSFLTELEEVAPAGYPVHLKVDTGMHRVGIAAEDALDLARAVVAGPLRLEGVWTHFPVSEEDAGFTADQATALQEVVAALRSEGIDPELVHAANTAAALDLPAARFDLVRPGIGVYGLRPAPGFCPDVELRPAMRVVSHVSFVQRLPQGTRPSYGRVRPMPEDGTVVTVPIGYADGVRRGLRDAGGEVLIGGRRHPFAGNITMDQVLIDVGDAAVNVGDEVVLLGRQGDDEITADEWAERLGTINWEIVCGFGPRLPRRYLG
jgi:alanine racemase